MDRENFERLVRQAINNLPSEFLERLENIDVVLADKPTRYQVRKAALTPGSRLLGLYEGVPLTRRGKDYGFVTPDKITIFQKPIEEVTSDGPGIVEEISRTVKHEIAHHFGISDARLKEIDKGKSTA